MSGTRLGAVQGTRVDRSRPISFQFNGRTLSGFAGDTLASALLANGVRLVGRSFKLHRPRGIFSCGAEEPNALVDVGVGARRTPNQRATLVDLHEGLTAVSVNCWPSVAFDLASVNARLSALLPAGFYYKTFKWPSWHVFEPAIRRMAGLGRASREPDPDRYEEVAATVDVLVVGGGIAGLTTATAAAESGARTMLVTSGSAVGGVLAWADAAAIAGLDARAVRAGVQVLTHTLAFGVYDHGLVCARETLMQGAIVGDEGVLRERLWKIRARHVVAAAGAFERPMLFPDNDRPGVMLAGAAAEYARAFGVACGRRVVIAANSDSAYRVAELLIAAGIDVLAVVDRRQSGAIGAHPAVVRALSGVGIVKVHGTRSVRGCRVAAPGSGARAETFDCDLILSAGGHAPAVHLHSQAGGRLRWLEESAMFVPDGHAPGVYSVGACAGLFERGSAEAHARVVGQALARGAEPPVANPGGVGSSLTVTHLPGIAGKHFVDLQNDVTVADVGLAAQENYRSVEHLKRYTTTGMGTDQGKTSNINALGLMGEFTGRGPATVGTTKFRPPFAPVSLGVLVGRRVGSLYRPLKRLPAEAWHVARGATFEQFGSWLRPAAYSAPGESLEAAAQREALAVRTSVGVMDGSPLGKLDIFGRDAAEFLDLMYLGTLSTLRVGQARYALLLNEHGVVMDDGIVARLGENHFWVNTTSAGIERTTAAFEEWLQCEYIALQVAVTPVTSRWGNVTVAGPSAWKLLSACGFEAGFAPDSMPHMTLRDGMLDGVPLRLLRASFSGELGYEINLPVNHTEALLQRLWGHAADFALVPYGIEALEILRTEKGYLHIGTDTDGTTLPGDLGFGRAVATKEANFVGRASLSRPAALDPMRPQLVAFSPLDGTSLLPVGAQIAAAAPPTMAEGHITSSYHSPWLRAPIALGMLMGGSQRLGDKVRVHHLGTIIEAVVVKAPFVDRAMIEGIT